MSTVKISARVKQKLIFDVAAEVAPCPDAEFSDVECLKIGDTYYLPNIEWTKYVPPDEYGDDGAGGFEAVEGGEWELLHHAITSEQTRIKLR